MEFKPVYLFIFLSNIIERWLFLFISATSSADVSYQLRKQLHHITHEETNTKTDNWEQRYVYKYINELKCTK